MDSQSQLAWLLNEVGANMQLPHKACFGEIICGSFTLLCGAHKLLVVMFGQQNSRSHLKVSNSKHLPGWSIPPDPPNFCVPANVCTRVQVLVGWTNAILLLLGL